jgi:hypothetical protein
MTERRKQMKYYDKKQGALANACARVSHIKSERKYRRLLKDNLKLLGLMDEYGYLVSPETPVEESRHFLQRATDQYFARLEEGKTEFLRIAEEAGVPCKDAEYVYWEILSFRQEGEDVLIDVFGVATYRNIVLHNAHIDGPFVSLNDYVELSKTEEGYLLEILEAGSEPFSVSFSHAERRCLARHAAGAADYFDTPWGFLTQYARGIAEHIREGIANERELVLRDVVEYFSNEQVKQIPEAFLELAHRHGAECAVEKYADKRQKLFRELSKQKYEPMWRELYEVFEASQEGLPQEWELYATPERFEEHKKIVTEQMHAHGFEGEYPHFCKRAPLRRLILRNPFGLAFEKYASYHIYCRAAWQRGEMSISEKYLCGTVFRKSAEEKTDIWSCLFNRRGKTNFETVFTYSHNHDNVEQERALIASAAVKCAELKPLTRKERGFKQGLNKPLWLLLFGGWIMGLLFGLGFLLLFTFVPLLVSLIFTGSFEVFVELFQTTPPWTWWVIGGVPCVLLGLELTIIKWIRERE